MSAKTAGIHKQYDKLTVSFLIETFAFGSKIHYYIDAVTRNGGGDNLCSNFNT